MLKRAMFQHRLVIVDDSRVLQTIEKKGPPTVHEPLQIWAKPRFLHKKNTYLSLNITTVYIVPIKLQYVLNV